MTEDQLCEALSKAGLEFEIVRSEEGIREVLFEVEEPYDAWLKERGKIEDWKVEYIADSHYAIFHKEISQEWVDEDGENPCFETAKEAREYLEETFK